LLPPQLALDWDLLLLLAGVSLLSGLLFYAVAKGLRLVHVPFWTALGVFLGIAALPFILFARREPPSPPDPNPQDAEPHHAGETPQKQHFS